MALSGVSVVSPSADTSGATDYAAIVAGAAALSSGGTVVLAPGTYYVNDTIDIPKNVGIEGIGNLGINTAGHTPVVIYHVPATSKSLFRCTYTRDGAVHRYIGPIRGITAIAGDNSLFGAFMESVYEIRMDRCAFVGFGTCVRIQDTLCTVLDQVYTEGGYLGGNFGVELIAGPSYSTTVKLRDCRLRRADWAVYVNVNACYNLILDGCIVESCREGVARLRDGHTVIRDVYVEELAGDNDVYATEGATYSLTYANEGMGLQAAVADATAETIVTQFNALLDRLRMTGGAGIIAD